MYATILGSAISFSGRYRERMFLAWCRETASVSICLVRDIGSLIIAIRESQYSLVVLSKKKVSWDLEQSSLAWTVRHLFVAASQVARDSSRRKTSCSLMLASVRNYQAFELRHHEENERQRNSSAMPSFWQVAWCLCCLDHCSGLDLPCIILGGIPSQMKSIFMRIV
mmetsp:Transcript_33981/g.82420  ORF Transcript_33981/g.82420 Transcript_33981/m.82420 type:complete len:167 (-) Transcript_33981:471-971(-)